MTTASRTEINRANAQHSTGPRTEAGKQKSSQNALRHGLTGQVVVMPAEDLAAYQRRLASYVGEYQPVGATEEDLVQSLADCAWRLNRILGLETNLGADLSLHSQRISRQFERTVNQLRDLQKTRKAQEEQDLDQFLDIVEMFEEKGETYDPSEDGFVFSEQQINENILRRNRERLNEQVWDRRVDAAFPPPPAKYFRRAATKPTNAA